MNVQTITMEPEKAKEKLEAYKAAILKKGNAEYEAAVRGYDALSKGTPLLNLSDVFRETGLNEQGLPKLAIARADKKQVEFCKSSDNGGTLVFSTLAKSQWGYTGSLLFRIPFQMNTSSWDRRYSLVPMVPPECLPKDALKNYFVLWEVENWSKNSLTAIPDKDPFLLKHIIGDLYAIVAEWDLTELEMSIMTGRRGN